MATDAGRYGTWRQQTLLGVLVTILAVVLAYAWTGGWNSSPPAGGAGGASNRQARPGQAAKPPGSPEELDVRLEALRAGHEGPRTIERNPFRFEARRRAEPEESEGGAATARPTAPQAEPPPMPTGPPAPPPIPLKFIGIIDSAQSGRLAALSDGRRVFQGREGDIIDGRYRIVRIGVESIVMEYADGSGGQQTIRLSGQ